MRGGGGEGRRRGEGRREEETEVERLAPRLLAQSPPRPISSSCLYLHGFLAPRHEEKGVGITCSVGGRKGEGREGGEA